MKTPGNRNVPTVGIHDTEAKVSLGKTLGRLLGYLTRQRGRTVLVIVSMIGYAAMLATLPALVGMAINVLTTAGGTITDLWPTLIMILGSAALIWVFGFISYHILADMSQDALLKLRQELFAKMQKLSLNFFDRQPIGELMSRVTNDTDIIEQFFKAGIEQVLQNVLTIVLVFIAMLLINPGLTLVAILIVPIILLFSWLLGRIAGPAFEKMQDQTGELNGFAEERLAGQKVIIAYRQQASTSRLFLEISDRVRATATRAQFTALVSGPVTTLLSNLEFIVLTIVAGYLVIEGHIPLGDLVAFLSYSQQFTTPLSQIFRIYHQILGAAAGAGRVFLILDEEPSVQDLPSAPQMPTIAGEVAFDHVDFSYIPGRRVLRDNHFLAKPGQYFGLCGPTGAGKSTIINILTRYYDLDSGQIRVDGVGIETVQQNSLRQQIAQVLQEPFLFSETIMENLRYAREGATDAECIASAKQANAHDFIMRQPQGYQTLLTEGGANISQGQRQMLTIARAMVANPHLLILDEATSNVDTRTEKLIQEGLIRLQEGKTSFVIAHRLSTIRGADQILVINRGEIIEQGSHAELMAKQGFYYNLFMSQFRGKLAGIVGSSSPPLPAALAPATEPGTV
jgi:ATP-binding cassette subfamily B protein